MSGKGDLDGGKLKQRPMSVPRERFDAEWERLFAKCPKCGKVLLKCKCTENALEKG